jgi:hypothetical protein
VTRTQPTSLSGPRPLTLYVDSARRSSLKRPNYAVCFELRTMDRRSKTAENAARCRTASLSATIVRRIKSLS